MGYETNMATVSGDDGSDSGGSNPIMTVQDQHSVVNDEIKPGPEGKAFNMSIALIK